VSAIAICSGKGSPGATFVAVNLAVAMARTHERVMLVDLDPSGGDIAAYLGLDPHRGLYPLLRMDRSVPEATAIAGEAEERFRVLAVGGFPVEASSESRDSLPDVMKQLREWDGELVVDLGRVTASTVQIAADADLVLVVARPDLVSVLGAERAMRALRDGGIAREGLKVIVSGADRRRPADVAEIATALRADVLAPLPFDRRAARRSLVAQTPVAKGRLVKAFGTLASTIAPGDRVESPPRSRDLIGVPA
jgi:MinD-like ATPase involved in chromosome partitioning or flagellar assembly